MMPILRTLVRSRVAIGVESVVGCASFTWVTSGGGAVRLRPKAVPEFAAADIEGTQRCHRCRAILDPTHSRSFESFTDDFAPCFRRAAADVPSLAPVGRVVRAMAVFLEVADQLA